jgi:cytoskeletal protein RodZ
MKKISEILSQARVDKKYSLIHLENVTRIKMSFIEAIEKGDWDNLPPFPTVLGFVKSLAKALSIDEGMAVAVLKRDYPPKKLRISPKPDVTNKFIWSPKLTFTIGVGAILLVLFGYLGIQYYHFISSPRLTIESPKENQVVTVGSINVFGVTDSDAKVVINNQPVEISLDGKFNVSLDVVPETKEIVVQASSRSSKITTIRRTINVQSN